MAQQQSPKQGVGFIFYNLLKDPKGVQIFRDFLKAKGNENHLSFCLEAMKFRAAASSHTPGSLPNGATNGVSLTNEQKLTALELYHKFLVSAAPLYLPLPPTLKTEIDNAFSHPDNPVSAYIFDKAASDVAETLQEDSFKQFIRTPQYEEYQLTKEARDGTVILCKLPGETLVVKPFRVLIWDAHSKSFVQCSLYITNFRLTFGNFSNPSKASDLELLDEICSIPLGCILRLVRSPQRTDVLEIHCKDIRRIEFLLDGASPFPPPAMKFLKKTIKAFCFPKSVADLFAFYFKPTWSDRKDWQRYNIYEEFLRQNISFQNWRFTDINHDFSMCGSYPARFVVPASVSDEQLQPVFGYRSKGRIPILSWSHPITGASICRSSQPLTGMLRTRCPEDEQLIKAISDTCGGGAGSKTLFLLDARPIANALGNTVKGKGFENLTAYSNCKIEFLGIANIHSMRESFQKLESLCISGNEEQWLTALCNTKWLYHVRDVMSGALRSVELLELGYPILLHCSDGWDRTAQVASLSLLLLDSFYRTIDGFIVLIEKEWLACGHHFHTRTGHADKNHANQERSPVFLQFLDCVFQVISQFQCSFEFNETFLLTIAHHLYTCQFGTFLFDSDQDRITNDIAAKTTSLWSYINHKRGDFLNPFYLPDDNALKPSVHMDRLVFWSNLYLQCIRKRSSGQTTTSSGEVVTVEMRGMMFKATNEQMVKRLRELEKEVAQLRAAAATSTTGSSPPTNISAAPFDHPLK